ncbi:hypothetical protein [Phenylobacterium sp.]|uniref:hypothetical protein n=1 Tax=Phenylobacterium sp. TaxID=1871053 RepID=UPI0025FEDEC6|nr:hypothetical protein [Phenylobacterium sp.]
MADPPASFADLTGPRNYRWPKKGDRLLRSAADWNKGVTFAQSALSRHVYIWSGYMRAAEALIESCADDPPTREVLVYPILFTYRHGIELAMKWIIARYGRHASVEIGETEHHNLWELWGICRSVITELGGTDDAATPVVEQLIKDFHDLDKSALAFRYSERKDGVLIRLPDGAIDLDNVRDVMEGVSHFFDGADGLLDANVSASPY